MRAFWQGAYNPQAASRDTAHRLRMIVDLPAMLGPAIGLASYKTKAGAFELLVKLSRSLQRSESICIPVSSMLASLATQPIWQRLEFITVSVYIAVEIRA